MLSSMTHGEKGHRGEQHSTYKTWGKPQILPPSPAACLDSNNRASNCCLQPFAPSFTCCFLVLALIKLPANTLFVLKPQQSQRTITC